MAEHRPSKLTAAGAFIAGMVTMPSDFIRREPGRREAVRFEVPLVLMVTAACIALGAVVGWQVAQDGGGVLIGSVVGLLGSMLPTSIGVAVLRRGE